jgi:release factor glutamine methyltransferase
VTTPVSDTARAAATARLRAAGCVFAEAEVAVLAAAAEGDDQLSALVERRAGGLPLEHVVGHADFCGVRVRLRPGVFVPRVRSELLVRHAVDAVLAGRSRRVTVLDLCCGSGALGATVAARVPSIELHASDLDPAAVACARDNLAAYGGRVHAGDLFDGVPNALRGAVDVLIANVPYVPAPQLPLLPAEARLHEPALALDGGADGLDVLRRVAARAPYWLAPGGILLSEVTALQADPAAATLIEAGLEAHTASDDSLDATIVIGRRSAVEGPSGGSPPSRPRRIRVRIDSETTVADDRSDEEVV